MTAPRLADHSLPVLHTNKWQQIKTLSRANQVFTPVEIKAYYVIGLIDDICKSVQCLVKADKAWPEKYLPAFSLFASAVDLLGRCLTGNRTLDANENLRVGFWYLARPHTLPPQRGIRPDRLAAVNRTVVVPVPGPYRVANLIALRHYSSHGQAAGSADLPDVDSRLLERFPELLGEALEVYWAALIDQSDEYNHNRCREYCARMADALVDPYPTRSEPLSKTLEYFAQGNSAGGLFYGLDWRVEVS
jgi:hypothetical protein